MSKDSENMTVDLSDQSYRILSFLLPYVDFRDGLGSVTQEALKQAVNLLIKENVFTPEELRYECLREQNAIIPWDWIYGEEVWRTEN